jgi:hypothetical protein
VLLNEVEEFGKFYGRHTQLNVGFEALTPKQARPFGGGYHLDLDQLEVGWWRQFATIILRRAPNASRPSADYALAYANRYYEVWERRPGVQIFDHLNLQAVNQRGTTPQCATVRAVAQRAPSGTSLVAAPVPDTVSLDPVSARDRPNGWPPLPAPPGVVSALTPGAVSATRPFAGGSYDVWVRGSGGRPVSVRVDGRTVAQVEGIDTQGQWSWGGTVRVPAGAHRVTLARPGGGLGPGDGAPTVLGPVDFVSHNSPSGLHWVPRQRWHSLCTSAWDWIEAARR